MNTEFSNDENVAIVYAVNMILMNADSVEQEDIDKACEEFTYEKAEDQCFEPWNRYFLGCDNKYQLHNGNRIFLELYKNMTIKNIKVKMNDNKKSGKMSVEVNNKHYEVKFFDYITEQTSGYELFFDFETAFEHQADDDMLPEYLRNWGSFHNPVIYTGPSEEDEEDDSLTFSDSENDEDYEHDNTRDAAPAA